MKKSTVLKLVTVTLLVVVAVTCFVACTEDVKVIPSEVQAMMDKINAVEGSDYYVSPQETLAAGQLTFIQCDVDLTRVYYYLSATVNRLNEKGEVIGRDKGVSILFVNEKESAANLYTYFREFMGIGEGKDDNGKYRVAQSTTKNDEEKEIYLVIIGTIEGVADVIA